MKKEQIEKILNDLLSTGGDFAEVFLEDTKSTAYCFIDSIVDQYQIKYTNGLGLRLASDNNIYYGATSDFSDDCLNKIISNLNKNINSKIIYNNVSLEELKVYPKTNDTHYTHNDIKTLMHSLDDKIRTKDKRITQVSINLVNTEQNVTIANHTGLYVKENRIRSRIYISVNFKDGENNSNAHYSKGLSMSLNMLDDINFDEEIDKMIKAGIDKLYAKPCLGKVMPVVIGTGFCGTVFHEACGHAMEATAVADKQSVLSNDLGKQIASNKVNIIDDGTIENEWGSTQIDDEGHETKKNILIKDGVLKGFLIDDLNSRKMHMASTGSARRQNYLFAPTSRMNNTYLEKGTDKIEDMIKSIDLGLYVVEIKGGLVKTSTGEFNFGCDLAYMIRDGKLAECVKSASLIGNTKEILKEVEMVSDDLSLAAGSCGSSSGWVPVNVGEPTIKIGHILVGGEASEE